MSSPIVFVIQQSDKKDLPSETFLDKFIEHLYSLLKLKITSSQMDTELKNCIGFKAITYKNKPLRSIEMHNLKSY